MAAGAAEVHWPRCTMSAAATCSAAQQLHRPAGRQLRQQCSQQQRHAGSQAGGAAPHRRGPWAAAAAAAAAAPAAPLSPPPQLQALDSLDRSCASTSISQDQLSEQQQEYFVNCGAAVRALQKVRRGGIGCMRGCLAWAWTGGPVCTARHSTALSPPACSLLLLPLPPPNTRAGPAGPPGAPAQPGGLL